MMKILLFKNIIKILIDNILIQYIAIEINVRYCLFIRNNNNLTIFNDR